MKILFQTGLSILVIMLCTVGHGVPGPPAQSYPHASLESVLESVDFDPSAPGSFLFVVAADIHYDFKADPPEGPETVRTIVREVNAMPVLPRVFIIAGDLITHGSHAFGQVPGPEQKRVARQEFMAAKTDLSELDDRIRRSLVPGNHDTYPYEDDFAMFREAFPNINPYESFDIEGIQFLMLAGGHSGHLGPVQMKWAQAQIDRTPPGRTVVTVIHQNSLGRLVRERGVGEAVRTLFSDWTGELWLIAGHGHGNQTSVFQLPRTVITQASVTTTSSKWGSESPGYWIYGVRDGVVEVRVFRRLGQGFRMDPVPCPATASPIPQPFEDMTDRVWTVMVGEGDKEFLKVAEGGDCEYFWFYVRNLHYCFPLRQMEPRPDHLLLLAEVRSQRDNYVLQVDFSADGEEWAPVETPEHRQRVYRFPIPENLRGSEELHVRVRRRDGASGQIAVGGFSFQGAVQ